MSRGTVLFAWRRTPPPFFIGGAEVSQRLLAEELTAAGWTVIYLGAHHSPWNTNELPGMLQHLRASSDPLALSPRTQTLRYTWNGIHCHAVPQDAIEQTLKILLQQHCPDLVVCSQEGAADLARRAGEMAPVAGWVHAVSKTSTAVLDGNPRHVLATSAFTASRLPSPSTRPVLFYPPFRLPSPGGPLDVWNGDLLMVNPVPAKGADLVRKLIEKLPDRHFTLVEGWWDTSDDFNAYPNVTYLPQTEDLDPIYVGHRLLLVPSICEDAFPRVITEAALQRLPALGSRIGGIPESIRDDDRTLPPNDLAAWTDAITVAGRGSAHELGSAAYARALRLSRPCIPELIAEGVLPG
ncbi:glycosyltransferase [Phytomonospora endophytica]|uniref:Glycosyltransferase involved in cell wall biosynthesis n=1 Tax=Phytomonospora endophytica TaxID=714109 RepID=A0A841FQ03_9ACTN|nr:glycosyltransferase [Phytomonospora endophytica]MBB6038205.1 glycosyltransferase involved in cell wall biosynthesis [Phytomonospora endophytica]GIG67336.1 hypothetical protein Pen01_36310 [Phytomonospora endophytica]